MTFKREYERLNIKPYAPRMAPTPIPIPDPFDDPLRCLRINAAWASHLLGVLEALDQEDAWIGTDDEIEAARQWVREIAEYLLGDNCETPPVPEPPQPPNTGDQTGESIFIDCGCDGCDEGDCDMGGCCIDKLEWRNGVLYYRRCGEWYPTEGGEENETLPPEDDPSYQETEDPEIRTDWQCAKATVVAELCYKLINSTLENYTLELWPSVYGEIAQEMGFNPKQTWLMAAVAILTADDLVPGSLDDINTEARKSKFLCNLLDRLDGSNNDIGENQMQIIEDELTAVAPPNYSARTFSAFIVRAIGRENMRAATRHAIMTDYTCEQCEPQPISLIPDDVSHDWAHYYDFKVDQYGWELMGKNASQTDGQGITSYPTAYNDALSGCKKNVATPAPDGFTFTFFWVKYTYWPTPNTGGVSYWFKIGASGTVLLNDASLWGLPIIQTRTNKHINQGEPVEIGSIFTYGNPPSGASCLEALIIAGTGADPWPDDPDYIPS